MIRTTCAITVLLLAISGTHAADVPLSTAQQAINAINIVQGNDAGRLQLGPKWTDSLGLSAELRGGLMLSEALAAGFVATLGENERALVLNGALRLDHETIVVGTLAAEAQNIAVGDSRDWVSQYEGGLSLRHDLGAGSIAGYEINAYVAMADTQGAPATGTLYGAEAALVLHPWAGLTAKLGTGYERIDWADHSDPTEGLIANLNLAQDLGSDLRLTLGIDYGKSENRYTVGTEYKLAESAEGSQHIGIEYAYIAGEGGIADQHRLLAFWRAGYSETTLSHALSYSGNVSVPEPADNSNDVMLRAVMEKPAYLPVSAVAKSTGGGNVPCSEFEALLHTSTQFSIHYLGSDPAVIQALISSTLGDFIGTTADNMAISSIDNSDAEELNRVYMNTSSAFSLPSTVVFVWGGYASSCNFTLPDEL